MLINITIFIVSLITLNLIIFLVSSFLSKNKQNIQKELSFSEPPIKLKHSVEETSTSQDLAPTGS